MRQDETHCPFSEGCRKRHALKYAVPVVTVPLPGGTTWQALQSAG